MHVHTSMLGGAAMLTASQVPRKKFASRCPPTLQIASRPPLLWQGQALIDGEMVTPTCGHPLSRRPRPLIQTSTYSMVRWSRPPFVSHTLAGRPLTPWSRPLLFQTLMVAMPTFIPDVHLLDGKVTPTFVGHCRLPLSQW